MVRTIATVIYMVVWGIATVYLLVRGDNIPAEYWTLPALGLGGILTAIGISERKKTEEPEEPKKDKTIEDAQ